MSYTIPKGQIKRLRAEKLASYGTPSDAELQGREAARTHGYDPARAAFISNLHKPTENPRHADLQELEDYLHGYYTEVVRQMQDRYAILEVEKRLADERANRASGPKRSRKAVGADSRGA